MQRELSERILLGHWAPGTLLPGEVELAERFEISVGTVRKALTALVAEGLLARRPRVGTVVTGRSPEHSLRFFFRYFRLHGADGSLVNSRPVTIALTETPAGVADAKRLGIAADAPVINLQRLRLVEDRPVMADTYRIPAARVPGFERNAAALPPLLYLHLLENWGIRITAVREELRAELATSEDRRMLALPDPASVMVIEAICFDQAGQACVAATQRARTDLHRYVNEVR